MIDIHSHILPDLDDGARTLEESIEMARIAVEDGITHMVATPHAFNGLSQNPDPEELSRRVDALQAAVGKQLEILPGNEVHFTHDFLNKAKVGRVLTLNRQNYMLVEFPTMDVPLGSESVLRRLQANGVTPILAHPERNLQIQRQPSLVESLIRSGVLMQVTAMSVTGRFGHAALDCVMTLLRHNCVHFIATDAHRTKSRPAILSEARNAAAAVIGTEGARKLVEENPRAVVTGETLSSDGPLPFGVASTNSGFSRFFRGRKRTA